MGEVMKKILLLILSLCLILTGCANSITLDNVDSFSNDYKYSKVSLGKLKECKEDMIIKDAKDFTNKYLSVTLNRSYADNKTVEQETIMFTEDYLETNKEQLEKEISTIKEIYKKYELTTELVNVDYKNIVNIKGDAYVNCVARVRLTECNDENVAKILGFDGLNSTANAIYNLKLKYIDKSYMVYDVKKIEKDGYMIPVEKCEDKVYNSLTEEDKLKHFAYLVSKAQNDRIYYEFSGDEDYKYLSQKCLAEINKDRDNAKYTKDLYTNYKLSTRLDNCKVNEIIKTEAGYTIKLVLTVEMLECATKELATQIGFPNGVGSKRNMNYEYYVVVENGEFKLDGSLFIN